MLSKGTLLKYYKRREIQEALVEQAQQKEVGTRYGDIFGPRPDTLIYPRDVLELALQNITSFHCSEEIWSNPLSLSSNLSRKELDELRSGWDLVLDIDCPDWEFSKITTHLFIKALKESGVKDISCKFSGNKGFHIGVPFEAFPNEVGGKKTKEMFPDGPKKISQYLLHLISNNYVEIKEERIIFDKTYSFGLDVLKEKFGDKKFMSTNCLKCEKEIKLNQENTFQFICPRCDKTEKSNSSFVQCSKCKILMHKDENPKKLGRQLGTDEVAICSCGSTKYKSKFDPSSIIEVDTVLISSRHLYRMAYSLHEKSGLSSLPLDPEQVMNFDKSEADPEKVIPGTIKFLERNIMGESGRQLLVHSLDFEAKIEADKKEKLERVNEKKDQEFAELVLSSPITEDFFPPCVQLILKGLEDGKKRAIFVLINFLGQVGWSKMEIELFLAKWNREKNREPLREVYLKGQLHNFKPGERLPPNCNNEAYCKGIGVCHPDAFCYKIKNPANYTLLKWRIYEQNKEEEEKKLRKKKVKEVKESKDKESKDKEDKDKEDKEVKELKVKETKNVDVKLKRIKKKHKSNLPEPVPDLLPLSSAEAQPPKEETASLSSSQPKSL